MTYKNIGFIRLDARAGFTTCTPGRTVPCGKVCRTPANCRKGKPGKERIEKIGKEALKEYAAARRSQRQKPPVKGGAIALAKKPRSQQQKSSTSQQYDPSIGKFAGKPATNETVKKMVAEQVKRPLGKQEGRDLYWQGRGNRHKTQDKTKIIQKERQLMVETFQDDVDSNRRSAEKSRQKASKTKSDKVRAKSEREAAYYESEAKEWEKMRDKWKNMSDNEAASSMNEWADAWTNNMNRHIKSKDPDLLEETGYTIATIKTGWSEKDFLNKSFGQGTTQADDHLKDVIRDMSGNVLGIKGKPRSAEELKAAYRRAARTAHPDTGGSAEKFREVQETYESMKRRYNFDSLYLGITIDYS